EPEVYKAKVRQCRLRADPTEEGADCKAERAARSGSFVQSAEASVSIMEEVSVQWRTQQQFMAQYTHVEGLGEAESAIAWDSAVSDPSVQRRGQGSDLRVAVRGAPRTVAQRTRTRRTTVAATRGIEASEEATFMQQGRVAVASATPTHSDFLDTGGEVFIVGAAMAGESSLASASAAEFATAVRADAPLPRPVIGPAELAVAPTAVKRKASNPPTPRRTAKKAPARASAAKAKKGKDEAVGAVLEARTEASRILRDAIRQHGSRRNNKASALQTMQDAGRLSQGQWEEVEPKTKEYLNLLIHLRVLSQEVNSWSLEHCAEKMATVMDNVARLGSLDTWLDEKLQSARASANVAARAKALAVRAERHAMAKATVAYQRLSLPVSWCQQLVDVGAVSNPAAYKPSKPEASDLSWTVPMWFGAESEGVGTALRSLRSACGEERVTQAL
ncbi:MAG: hypothetical protein GY772_06520, partial [bacterium]|nr:hypothetical protein [bacterium]